jgi:hypothetical protein
MSTYYYLLCDKHHEYIGGASIPLSGHPCYMGRSRHLLPHFLHVHATCSLLVRDEYSLDDAQEEYERWCEDALPICSRKKRD